MCWCVLIAGASERRCVRGFTGPRVRREEGEKGTACYGIQDPSPRGAAVESSRRAGVGRVQSSPRWDWGLAVLTFLGTESLYQGVAFKCFPCFCLLAWAGPFPRLVTEAEELDLCMR